MKKILNIAIATGFLLSVLSIGYTARAGFKPPREISELPVVSSQWDFDDIGILKDRVGQALKRYQTNEATAKWVAISVVKLEYDAKTGNYKVFGQAFFGKNDLPEFFWVCKGDFSALASALTYVKGYNPVVMGLVDENYKYIVAFGHVKEQW